MLVGQHLNRNLYATELTYMRVQELPCYNLFEPQTS
jgi:hypothetical protein